MSRLKVSSAASRRSMGQVMILMATAIGLYSADASGSARKVEGHRVTVTAETRKAAFRHVVQIWQDGRADLISDMITEDYVGHPSSGDRNAQGLRKRIFDFHQLYPDLKFTIEAQVAEGDRVATRLTGVGTASATGKPVRLIGLNISRFVGNRIAEEWPVWENVR